MWFIDAIQILYFKAKDLHVTFDKKQQGVLRKTIRHILAVHLTRSCVYQLKVYWKKVLCAAASRV